MTHLSNEILGGKNGRKKTKHDLFNIYLLNYKPYIPLNNNYFPLLIDLLMIALKNVTFITMKQKKKNTANVAKVQQLHMFIASFSFCTAPTQF